MLTFRRGSCATTVLATLTLLVLAAGFAHACPLCMSSDPALNNPGSQNSGAGQWRVTVENKSLSKLNGIVNNGAPRGTDHEFQHEDRLATSIGYQPTMRFGLALTVPFMMITATRTC